MDAPARRISLGLAELVCQLLRETFDGLLDAQGYQLDAYSALERALNTPSEAFVPLFVSDDEVQQREAELYGSPLEEGMSKTGAMAAALEDSGRGAEPGAVIRKRTAARLSAQELATLRNVAIETVVAEKKARIAQLVNNSGLARLMVDSGEIRVRAELSTLYDGAEKEASPTAAPERERTAEVGPQGIRESTPPRDLGAGREGRDAGPASTGAKIRMVIDPVSGRTTVLVERASLRDVVGTPLSIPKLRVIASPADSVAKENTLSEIVIRFKAP